MYELGIAQFCLEQFEQAATSLERATLLNPDNRGAFRLLLASYGWLDRSEEAEKALATINSRDQRGWQNVLDPITVRTSAFWHPFKNTADAERFAEGLRRAGLPE